MTKAKRIFKNLLCLVLIVSVIGIPSKTSFAEEVQYTDNVIPTMTSNTSPSGVASSSSIWSTSSSFQAWHAFDHSTTGNLSWASTTSSGWLAYEFADAKCITKYTIKNRETYLSLAGELPKDWTFEAWDEQSSSWVVLDTRSNITGWQNKVKKEFTFNNTKAYKKYRINVTANGDKNYAVIIGELEMMESVTQATSDSILKVVLDTDEQLQLSVDEDLATNTKVYWSSSDTNVATVDGNGVVTAINPGNAVITVKNKRGTYTDTVNVLVVDDATNYRLAVDLRIGKTSRLTVDDYTFTKNVTWTTMDSSVATINSKGKVTAIGEGLTIATATDETGNVIGQIYIRVRE